jgi:HK97 family phage portal protein
MNLRDALRGAASESRYSWADYLNELSTFTFGGLTYGAVQQTLAGSGIERVDASFAGYVQGAYKSNGVVFACMLARLLLFTEARFQYQRLKDGRPGDLYGTPALRLLERPWQGGTTGDLLARMLQDADTAGNGYVTMIGDELVRLRPDWVSIILEPRMHPNGGQVGFRRSGYLYTEGGGDGDPVPLLASEVAHFAPVPDPLAIYRGMSWLTPVIREIQADSAATRHKEKFFENGATPNMVVRLSDKITPEQFEAFKAKAEAKYRGVENAYKTMYVGGGADVTVVGADMKQIDFKATQGAGETRIAAAAGVPPVIVGLSEGLQAATYSNYGQARRRFADGTMRPLWRNVAASLEVLVPPGDASSRLWYDDRDIAFLREDQADAATIQSTKAQSIKTLLDAGYEADSVVAAVTANDFSLLVHSGLFSVQLQPAGADQAPAGADQAAA